MTRRHYIFMITAPILATSVLLLLIGGAAAWYVHQLNQEVSDLLARNLECMLASARLVLSVRDARVEMHRFLDTRDPEKLQVVVAIERTAAQHLRDAEQAAPSDDLRALIARTRQQHERFFRHFVAVTQRMSPATQQQEVRELTQTVTTDLLAPAEELLQRTQQAAMRHSDRSRNVADQIGLGLLALGTCGAVAGLLGGFGIARGIAAKMEQSEREANRSAQLATLGQLAAGLAHELRNPLTAMRLLVEAGREVGDSGQLDGRDLQVLDEEIGRLEQLVESFLDFARPPKLEKTMFDARSLVEHTMRLVGAPARQRGVTIDWRPPAEMVTVEADAVQMRQVVLNVLLNAMDAAGEGGRVSIEVEATNSNSAPNRAGSESGANIQISDDGPGISNDMKEKIFEPFYSSKEVGMGLGLAVSRRIVEAHGGQITVADNPGGGARFTIALPSQSFNPNPVAAVQAT